MGEIWQRWGRADTCLAEHQRICEGEFRDGEAQRRTPQEQGCVPQGRGGSRPNQSRQHSQAVYVGGPQASRALRASLSLADASASPRYTVPVPGGHLQLLNDIYGYVKPGELI